MDNGAEIVKLSTRDWIFLIITIAGGTAAVFGMHMRTSGRIAEVSARAAVNLQSAITNMDEKWQGRVDALARDFKADLTDIKRSIPPDWFRQMVDDNKRHIELLEQRIHELEDTR